jgi:O-antigen ligase
MTDIKAHSRGGIGENFTLPLSALLIIGSLPVVVMLAINRPLMALVYLAVPAIFVLLTMPRLAFLIFIVVNFIYYPIMMKGFAIHPGDICGLVFIASMIISWLLRGDSIIDRTRLDYPFLALIAATFISGIFAYKSDLSIVPVGRIIIIFFAYRAFYALSDKYDAQKMIRIYVYALTAFSLYNVVSFLFLGGVYRIFGFSGIAYETLSMIGTPLNLVYAVWAETKKKQFLFTVFLAVNLLAAVATMSRGLLITLIIAGVVVLFISYFRAKKLTRNSTVGYIKGLILVMVPLGALAMVTWGIFVPVAERFQEISLGRPIGTILLRLSLWKAAIQGFLTSPLTGIGIGNFRMIDTILPHLKFDPVRYYITGMSFHNVFLQYLCETGIIGAAAFLWLISRSFFSSNRILHRTVLDDDQIVPMAAFTGAFIIFITTFYMRAWTWGQEGFVFAFCLSLVAREYGRIKRRNAGSN